MRSAFTEAAHSVRGSKNYPEARIGVQHHERVRSEQELSPLMP
ncbi:hypothetical protein [Bacillus sp. MUM 13]|nr:hypothetical protein [Bacillus sp. MUM 13]